MSELKRISVVIPCRNEVRYIADCVEAIMNSTYKSFDVIVVDGMSDDGTRGVLDSLKKKYSNFDYINNEKQLTPYAFNLGVKAGTGDYIQIVGSRNILDSNYLEEMVKALEEDSSVVCVGGNYEHCFDSEMGEIIAAAMETKFGVGFSNYRTMTKKTYVDTVGVPMYRKEIFAEIGYFDEDLTRNQDDDYNYRVTEKGHKILYIPHVKALYYVRGNLKKLFHQMKQYGYFKVFVNKKHGTFTTLRQLIPPAFFLFSVISILLGLVFKPFFALLAFVYLLHGSLGLMFGYQRLGFGGGKVFLMPLAYFSMHLGYGFGYVKGVIDFIFLKRVPSNQMMKQTT